MSDVFSLDKISKEVTDEVIKATEKFGPMRSGHEGFAILKEEVDELWDNVKLNQNDIMILRNVEMRKEAVHVAAMAIRFIRDVCDNAD